MNAPDLPAGSQARRRTNRCVLCGKPRDYIGPDGRPYCTACRSPGYTGPTSGAMPEPSGPGIRCPGCGALPDEQHREECAERDPGPVAPSPWGDRPEPEDPDRDRMDDAELASHQAHEPEPRP